MIEESPHDDNGVASLARLVRCLNGGPFLDSDFDFDSDSGLRRGKPYKIGLYCSDEETRKRNQADILAALYNASRPQGRGFLQYDPTPMTREQAQELLDRGTKFGYIKGRVMHIDLSGDYLDPHEYDRDNGYGAAARAVFSLTMGQGVNSPHAQDVHISGTQDSARTLESQLRVKSKTTEVTDGEAADVFELGYSGVADVLRPNIEKITKPE